MEPLGRRGGGPSSQPRPYVRETAMAYHTHLPIVYVRAGAGGRVRFLSRPYVCETAMAYHTHLSIVYVRAGAGGRVRFLPRPYVRETAMAYPQWGCAKTPTLCT